MTDAATFCATLVDEWLRAGLTDAVACPGSRSTPLAMALADAADRKDLRLHVQLDERSGGFMALGLALASGLPAVVVTTSGTATVNLHPAVVEADLAGVPLIVCTADRPPELRDRGAPQTIDQTHLYGNKTRWYHDPGVPGAERAATWRPLAARAYLEAMGDSGRAGPVHLNLPFREPLTGSAGDLPVGRAGGAPWSPDVRPRTAAAPRPARLGGRGVVVAGRSTASPADLVQLASGLGWPLLADPRSGVDPSAAVTVLHADALLRHDVTASTLEPEVVLRIGEIPASRILNEWIASSGAHEIVVADRPIDPWQSAAQLILDDPGRVVSAWVDGPPASLPDADWIRRWREADDAARVAIASLVDVDPLTEPAVARIVMDVASPAHGVVFSSSMPVRDAEWYAGPRAGVRVFANRGANGIDGVTSTAVGVALNGIPTLAVLGDVAFLHDSNGLLGLGRREVDLTIVVIDNDGGGIFSFLPQARELAVERYERLFGTPHGVDPGGIALAHGIEATEAATREQLRTELGRPGVRVVVVRTTRSANADFHRRINQAVADSLTR